MEENREIEIARQESEEVKLSSIPLKSINIKKKFYQRVT